MINFIIVEDINRFLKRTENVIERLMMKNQFDYKVHTYTEFDDRFNKMMNSSIPNKIYILDVVTPNNSGIDVARKIRKEDVNSVIIFMTAHDELGTALAKRQLLALTMVSKFDDFEIELYESIEKALEVIGKRRVIKVQDNSSVYIIQVKDILYITTDSVDRKIIIKTSNDNYRLNKTLTEVKELVGKALIQTHRSCLVNEDRIVKVDKKNSIIKFDTGDTIDMLSSNFKKELV